MGQKSVRCVEKDLEELLNFYSSFEPLRKKPPTTNVTERVFRKLRRRTRPMSYINNVLSTERIVYAVLINLNDLRREAPKRIYTEKLTLPYFL